MKKNAYEQINKAVNYVGTYISTLILGASLAIGIEFGFNCFLAITTILSITIAGATAYNLYDMRKYEED